MKRDITKCRKCPKHMIYDDGSNIWYYCHAEEKIFGFREDVYIDFDIHKNCSLKMEYVVFKDREIPNVDKCIYNDNKKRWIERGCRPETSKERRQRRKKDDIELKKQKAKYDKMLKELQ